MSRRAPMFKPLPITLQRGALRLEPLV
ncbi:N-acetyltransferase, partial [Pseudomonas aeruginosa]|nr:N-acetyltransferase [Pseudomonas aeruginosa]